MLHTSKYNLVVGDDVLCGHRVMMHSCEIGKQCMLGMGCIIMDGAKVGDNCIIGAGSVIPPNSVIPDGSVAIGNPVYDNQKHQAG